MTLPTVFTGALSGLGLELAREPAARGRPLIATGRNADRATSVARNSRRGPVSRCEA